VNIERTKGCLPAANSVWPWGHGKRPKMEPLTRTFGVAGSVVAAVDLMNTNFFGGEMDLATRTSLLTYLRGGTFNDTRVRETLSLAIASESFQWY